MINSKKYGVIKLLAIAITLFNPLTVIAQNSALSGEIEMEQEEKTEDPYAQTEAQTIELFEKLIAFMDNPEKGAFDSAQLLPDNVLLLLNALYLHCSVNRGTCPQVLTAILEIDIIQSLRSATNQCKNMQRFWQLWLSNDMEKRQQYQVKTGYLSATAEFKNKTRPAFIKCVETVTRELETDLVGEINFLTKRYKEGSAQKSAVSEVLNSLKSARQAKLNLLQASGAGK